MDKRLFDAVAVITAAVLMPMIAVSAHAYIQGELRFDEYASMWREPLALLLGFWLRGVNKEA